MKYRIGIIVTWFGDLPDYFPAWLKSAENNKTIDFFFFSDQDIVSDAENIYKYKMTLEECVEYFKHKIQRPIEISSSYKFCDCRALFGVLFEDYLKGYDFWGYCDVDLMFGNIRHFLTDEVLTQYDRIYQYGHLSIFRNDDKTKHLYELPGARYSLDEVLTGRTKTTFEEHLGLNRISRINNIRWYVNVDFADFAIRHTNRLDAKHGLKNYDKQFFAWINGEAYQIYESNGKVKKHSLVYMHWQKRKPVIDESFYNSTGAYVVTSSRIIGVKIENMSDVRELFNTNRQIDTFKKRIDSAKYYNKKMKDFLSSDIHSKKMWIKQKYFMLFENSRGYK